ncbi:AGZA family xanthine/uracil permease-like MFS transporter [Hydrogenispora ethanolica]|uniref:AGZA family xanthine/uracil permease-like MFS transporter n=1 Tax=Hydrogenispora ethanolica TaxID=1082276 RepID=A0A4R1QW36_HYDET|nr:NCS2 family permease [Hydrogenispora ethanolica]TCL57441.1 AGZA family xanthine/uracil permease-like MFS transporter [Hydrogenispora ethanolica]
MLERVFQLKQNKTTVSREIVAGIVTFMTMAYIIFVNPDILANALGKEYLHPLIVATCVAAGIMSISMGLFTNYPLALASGMGLNAVVAYGLVLGMKLPWQTAMGVVFVEGVVITLLVLTKVREWVMDAIPVDLKRAIGVGIGLFIAFIGLKNAGLVVADPVTFLTFGKINPANGIALFGLLVTAVLMARRVKGAILIGIIVSTVTAMICGLVKWPTEYVAGLKPEYFSTFFQLDIGSALNVGLITTIFALMISDFFDTMGTVVAVGEEAGLVGKDGKMPRLRNVLLVDSLAAVCGGLFGCSSVTTYVESAAGVGEGGRTGLTAVVTGILFLLAIFFAPIVGIVPGYATAPALIVVGFLMLAVVKNIQWDDLTVSIPASLTIIMIPLTYSISKGIGYGFIAYVLIKVFSGKSKGVHPLMYIASIFFVIDFILSSRG